MIERVGAFCKMGNDPSHVASEWWDRNPLLCCRAAGSTGALLQRTGSGPQLPTFKHPARLHVLRYNALQYEINMHTQIG